MKSLLFSRKKLSFLLICFCMVTCLSAEENSLRVKIPLHEQKKVCFIEKDDSNIRKETLPADEKHPAGKGLASHFGKISEKIFWTPAMKNDESSMVLRIRDAVQSPDRTLLVFMEETGKFPGGPFGGRLIVYDTVSQRILRVIHSDRRLDRVDFLGNKPKVIVSALPEKRMPGQEEGGFAVFDLISGKEEKYLPGFSGSFAAAGKSFFLHVPGEKALKKYDLSGGFSGSVSFEDVPSRFSVSGNILAVSAGKKIVFTDISELKKISDVEIPSQEGKISGIFPLTNDGSIFAAMTMIPSKGRGGLFLIRKGTMKKLISDATGFCVPCGRDALVCSRYQKRQIARILLKNGRVTISVTPQTMRPQTYGNTAYLFPGYGENEVILMDTTGSLSVFTAGRTRWSKKLAEGISVRSSGS